MRVISAVIFALNAAWLALHLDVLLQGPGVTENVGFAVAEFLLAAALLVGVFRSVRRGAPGWTLILVLLQWLLLLTSVGLGFIAVSLFVFVGAFAVLLYGVPRLRGGTQH